MSDSSQNEEAERRGYIRALGDILSGKNLEEAHVEHFAAQNKGFMKRVKAIGGWLPSILGLALIISGAVFSGMQIRLTNKQMTFAEAQAKAVGEVRQQELAIARAKALAELIPSLTSGDMTARRYAITALLAASPDSDELRKVAEDVYRIGDPESLEVIAIRLGDEKLRIMAAELYAQRARRAQKKSYEDNVDTNSKTALLAAWRSDAKRAFDLSPQSKGNSVTTNFVVGDYLFDLDHPAPNEIIERFEEILSSPNLNPTSEEYLRSNLALTVLYQRMAVQAGSDSERTVWVAKAREHLVATKAGYFSGDLELRNYYLNERNEPGFHTARKWLESEVDRPK